MQTNEISVVFMGTPDFAATCLRSVFDAGYDVRLCICQPDKPVGRKHVITPPPAKVMAQKLGIEVFQPASMRTDEAYDKVKEKNPDLIITAAYGKILPQSVLDIPKYGPLNVHASLLPKYRGAAPVQYSIMNGDPVTGVTVMRMDAGMDTGDIVTSVEVPIDINIHTPELMNELSEAGSRLLLDTIPGFVDGSVKPVPQNEELATACPPIKPEQGLFKWSDTALSIHNRIRALSDWPGCSTIFNDGKFKIYDSEVYDESKLPEQDLNVEPGTVVKAAKNEIVVKCGQGYLKLLKVQSAGGKVLNSTDCAHNYKLGMRFLDMEI